jgi:large subunit ribosomal protein L17
MRHRKAGRKFGRNSSNRAAMFKNQVQSLLEYERIETTVPRAKEVRGIAERLITLGKRGGLHSVRLVERLVRKKSVITKLFTELAPRFKDRPGGYTRIVRTRRRLGDGAPMGFLELLPPPGGRPAKRGPAPEVDEKAEKKAAEAKPAKARAEKKRKTETPEAPKKRAGERTAKAEKDAAEKPKAERKPKAAAKPAAARRGDSAPDAAPGRHRGKGAKGTGEETRGE